jgi:clan AA aspartic protease
MGQTFVKMKVCKVDDPTICREVDNVIVDTGAMVSAIPEKIAKELGIKFPLTRTFTLADGSKVDKPVGTAILELDGRKASDDVITLSNGKGQPLIGVRALEGMGFQVDPRTGTLKKMDAILLL